MDSMDILSLDVLQPTSSRVQLALKHVDSDDFFQQLLSIDSALEALRDARNTLKSQLGAPNGDDVDGLIRRFEELQTAARRGFNLRARPRLRNLGILDLPDELLLKIFDCFSGLMGTDEVLYCRNLEVDVETIKSARLTCRRLCDTSSHLLVPCLYLNLSPSSLKRLEEVTNHPKISHGPRVFKINVEFHSATMANDLQDFASMCYRNMLFKTQRLERSIEDEEGMFANHYGSESVVRADIEKSRHILSCWEPLASGEQVREDAELDEAVLALRRGHERYRELFEQQQSVLKNGLFARVVAAAAARSRSKVWLFMSDSENSRAGCKPLWHTFNADPELLADPDRLVQSGLLPALGTHEWSYATGKEAGEAPHLLLYNLPLEMRAAGVSLVGLRVSVTPWQTPDNPNQKLSNDQLVGFSEVVKTLRVFDFSIVEREPGLAQSDEDMSDLLNYRSAAMGQRNIPKSSSSLSAVERLNGDLDSGVTSIGPLLTSPAWPRIKTIRLQSFCIDLDQLRKVLGLLGSGTCIKLLDMHLHSGTWADALDFLRSRAGRGSRLESPLGAEIDNMTRREYLDAFGGDPNPEESDNLATQYINSLEGIKNPLRKGVEAPGANP